MKIGLRSMVILLAVVPFLASIFAVIYIIRLNSAQLAQLQIQAVTPLLIEHHKNELKNFIQVARRAIVISDDKSSNIAAEKKAALELLRRMDFGDDNYLYVYDTKGLSLMHPRLKHLEGMNQWELRDSTGNPVIQGLILAAISGDGFMDYKWSRPSTGREESKLGYVEFIPQWNWIIGTGLYIDDLHKATDLISKASTSASHKTLNQILLIALVGLIIVACGGAALTVFEKRTADSKLRVMAKNVLLSTEAERARVARELHDGVIQMMASVKFIFETSLIKLDQKSVEAEVLLREGLAQMRRVMADVRAISHGLRPLILSDLGLESAIKKIASEFSERNNIPVLVKISPRLSPSDPMGAEIFRLVQEALANIEAHAHASFVWIDLTPSHKGLSLQIKDNGIGFNVKSATAGVRSGHGLTNMRERVEMLGGSFSLTSKPGETLIDVQLDESIINP